jgi:hypothetical protein
MQIELYYGSIWQKLLHNISWKSSIVNLNKTYETVYEIHVKVYLWPYVNQALLWINMTENLDCPFDKKSPMSIFISICEIIYGIGISGRALK